MSGQAHIPSEASEFCRLIAKILRRGTATPTKLEKDQRIMGNDDSGVKPGQKGRHETKSFGTNTARNGGDIVE